MNKKILLALLLALPAQASAAPAGQLELQAIVGMFSSPLGFAIGLAVTAFGVWQFIVAQKVARGLILIVLGVVVTGFPSLYNGLRKDFYTVPAQMGGSGSAGDFNQYVGGQ